MPTTTKLLRLAIDTGGTFTDCAWRDPRSGTLRMLKVFSTPKDPSRAIADAIAKTGHDGPVLLLHGTTVGTNSLLQRKGGRVAFVTTKGFEDSIQIGRQARPKLYDLFFDAIEPLVPPELRFGVTERTDKDGNTLRAPAPQELAELARKLKRFKPDAIAISFLFSFANSANERAAARALDRLSIPLSVSHQILPEFREYERASTVVVNAYLQPVMSQYLRGLSARVPRNSRVFVMQSSGGLTALETAAREPVRTVLSGPAGGVVGAAAMAKRGKFTRIIGFDMGGTSTDVCLVDGAPHTTNEAEVAGLPVRVPMLNIHTVGAGGGSLARFDAGGALRVGPESAGADPGPICYGRSTQPTVTDANLLLGRLPADRFLGGDFQLDAARTHRVVADWLRRQKSKLSLEAFAEGMVRVVNANMEKAIRLVSVEKGYDPREFTLVAFGGAGALHACDLAAALEIPRVLVPAMPGALSALGILMSDVVKDLSRTIMLEAADRWPASQIEREINSLRARAAHEFKKEKWVGKIRFQPSVDLRYKGQGFEINIPFDRRSLSRFHAEHARRYGYRKDDAPVEIVTVRLKAWIASPPVALKMAGMTQRSAKAESRQVVLAGRAIKTAVLSREHVGRNLIPGPAILTEYGATTLVPPGWQASTDMAGNFLLRPL